MRHKLARSLRLLQRGCATDQRRINGRPTSNRPSGSPYFCACRPSSRVRATGPAVREPRRVMPCSHAHASRGGHSRPAGWQRGGRRRAAGGGGRGRGTGRGAAVRSESWIRSQARARVATRTRTSTHAHAWCMLVRRARKRTRKHSSRKRRSTEKWSREPNYI